MQAHTLLTTLLLPMLWPRLCQAVAIPGLEEHKKSLLKALDLEKEPVSTGRPSVPVFVQGLYDAYEHLENVQTTGQDIRAKPSETERVSSSRSLSLLFHLQIALHQVSQLQLVLQLLPQPRDQFVPVPQPVICENTLHLCKQVTGRRYSKVTQSTQWDMFDLSYLLTSWNTSGVSKVTSEDVWLSFPQSDFDPSHIYRLQGTERPLLVSWRRPELPQVLENIGAPTRRRRSYPAGTQAVPVDTCSLQSWNISFAEFGWDWIVQPESFIGNYCDGECPENDINSLDVLYTGNAMMRASYRQAPSSRVGPLSSRPPAPHCAAIAFDQVLTVFRDANSTIRVRAMEEMVATGCACV